jgi:hypothetical protein
MKKLLMIAAIFSFTLGTTLAQDVPLKKEKENGKPTQLVVEGVRGDGQGRPKRDSLIRKEGKRTPRPNN